MVYDANYKPTFEQRKNGSLNNYRFFMPLFLPHARVLFYFLSIMESIREQIGMNFFY